MSDQPQFVDGLYPKPKKNRARPNALQDPSVFWKKTDKDMDTGCLNWTGALWSNGYGQVWIGGKKKLAHRIAVMLDGRDPGDQIVMHSCNNRKCVNPGHLEIGTHSENTLYAYKTGAMKAPWQGKRGMNHPRRKFTEEDRENVVRRRNSGMSYREAGSTIGMSVSEVYRCCQRART